MEKAISKFLGGMKKQEQTVFDEVQKLLHRLPVLVEKKGTSMMQAEALEGGHPWAVLSGSQSCTGA